MDIRDYEDPADPSAPRHKASQRAKRRPREATEAKTAPVPRRVAIGVIVAVLLVISVIGAQQAYAPAGPLQVMPAEIAPARMFHNARDTTSPPVSAATPPPTAPTTTIGAYAAPDGLLLGQIETTRQIVPVAHYGAGWIAYQDGAGLVWLRAGDVPGVALAGPDLAPRADVVPQTGQGLTLDQGGDDWTTPEQPAAEPMKGQKEAPDRARAHAAAVARDRQPHEVP